MAQKIRIKPLGDRVLVEPVSEEDKHGKTKSGIIIPDTVNKERPEEGRVVACGEGKVNNEGALVPLKVKKGDRIIFSKYGPDEIKIDGKEYLIVSESNILAIIED
ncbi:MAG TPA: co-chaperone GroES [Candidatus Vogelbacteria bacterium]|uniref:Co-chaperonin GroES n=1 Tax=Candidatus Vogelbacteria bacterium RIFOXYD1_FULL_51_18 TaxID=1802440 RepID=A0A1G2QJB9_9BACT|nr:MAG: 10 kDa chaperonin [Parcubacteria group bacterium GW2011_GWC1_51_35]KKW24275.1 MAG: 10 kDa chaperonin [Parcubacteria group bacterium GW2011_GWF2_52_12]KKW26364.1 MAG: 10 kDa chaperonin [Parcubacteria group bacterium GW2011_GWF1_52_5]KKW34682.1 MAG: 10 kDa chaperonin [Parcubacteria group bacterium GW2011_GWB1_53_43]KKW38397.1 MAG: 10 kDa chaperonin [Parcubacteria group bacterium GW2011_GWA1_54_88]OHA60503.1 MAG: co-chaperone GroES [Candidatus Vogelbacteria bacterium RIFOXYD1_FULL_51_18]